MPEFLVEFYSPRGSVAAVARGAERARRAAQQLTGEGTSVRFVRSLFVPEDETCFHLYEADSATAVALAAQREGLDVGHVAEAIQHATER